MELKDFVAKFAEQFEDTDIIEIKAETAFRDLEEWSSLLALSVMTMAKEEYGVDLKAEDIRNSKTVEDLYKIVAGRL